MVEWLRRLAGRPDVEFVVQLWRSNSLDRRQIRIRKRRTSSTRWSHIVRANLHRTSRQVRRDVSFVEQEIWHALGMFRPEPSKCDFEQYLKP
jgi:hypothetical protein